MTQSVSATDFIALQNIVGKYQWLVDGGDSEGWAALWTEDGAFSGGTAEPFIGHAALKQVPAWIKDGWAGAMRHHAGSIHIEYGASQDEAIVRYYSLVTVWNKPEPELFTFAIAQMRLLRLAGEWKIKSNTVTTLARPRALGETE
jgi:SnoaL-like domain